jgi:hypothetical protein
MFAAITLSRLWLHRSWKSIALQVAGGALIYVVSVLAMRDRFALQMWAIIKRNIPFLKKKQGK